MRRNAVAVCASDISLSTTPRPTRRPPVESYRVFYGTLAWVETSEELSALQAALTNRSMDYTWVGGIGEPAIAPNDAAALENNGRCVLRVRVRMRVRVRVRVRD